MKVIVMAYTSKIYKSERAYIPCDPVYTERADLTRKLPCMDTWVSRLKEKGHEVIFFDGDNEEVSFDEKNQILHLTDSDEYDYFYLHHEKKPSNMLKKLQSAVRWVLDNREFDYILRVDDGTYVNAFIFEDFFEKIKTADIVWSEQGGGGGVFFSRRACEELLKINNNDSHLEDVTIFEHFNKLDYKRAGIQNMSAFYYVGEKALTIHYATGKRMYYVDFIMSNYYHNLKTERKVIVNYHWDPNIPLNTNRVNGLNNNTGVWYGMDRDQKSWEYYGNYARSICDIYDREILFENDVIKNLVVFNLNNPHIDKVKKTIEKVYNIVKSGGELNLVYNIKDKNIDKITPIERYNEIINILKQLNYDFEIMEDVTHKDYFDAEYLNSGERANIIKLVKK